MIYDVHIFVCNNQRTGTDKLSCGDAHGLELVGEFKKLKTPEDFGNFVEKDKKN